LNDLKNENKEINQNENDPDYVQITPCNPPSKEVDVIHSKSPKNEKVVQIVHSQNQIINAIEMQVVATNIKSNKDLETIRTQDDQEKSKSIFNIKGKKHAGYLILLSGLIHNIMDGIAVGVTFASRKIPIIISTNIAILLHEIPKEMGDAGILLASNFSPCSVLFWNVANNITNIIGTIIGIAIGEFSEASNAYSMAFVAGNFFYIALAEMVPEIMSKKGICNQILQFSFIILGIGLMFIILLFENEE
jgi:zinc transporter ZupT